MMETKRCIRCQMKKSTDDFYAGQGNTCKECTKERSTAWRKGNPLRYRATRKNWEQGNEDLAVTRRKNRLKRRYGLSPQGVEEILVRQEYKCAICGVPLHSPLDKKVIPEGTTRPVIDHDHHDGHPRGALCSACNTGLGQFEDDPMIVMQAYYYLKADLERDQ